MRRLFRTYWNFMYLLEEAWKVLMKKKWGANKRKNFYSQMRGNTIRALLRGGGGGLWKSCGLSLCDGLTETVKYIWVNWCLLNWILSHCRHINCLQPMPMLLLYEMEENKNSGMVVILHCKNSFQMLFVFPCFPKFLRGQHNFVEFLGIKLYFA